MIYEFINAELFIGLALPDAIIYLFHFQLYFVSVLFILLLYQLNSIISCTNKLFLLFDLMINHFETLERIR